MLLVQTNWWKRNMETGKLGQITPRTTIHHIYVWHKIKLWRTCLEIDKFFTYIIIFFYGFWVTLAPWDSMLNDLFCSFHYLKACLGRLRREALWLRDTVNRRLHATVNCGRGGAGGAGKTWLHRLCATVPLQYATVAGAGEAVPNRPSLLRLHSCWSS